MPNEYELDKTVSISSNLPIPKTHRSGVLGGLRSRSRKRISPFFVQLLALYGQPLGIVLHATGYFDENGTWVDGTGSAPPIYDPWIPLMTGTDTDLDGTTDLDEDGLSNGFESFTKRGQNRQERKTGECDIS